MDWVYSSSTWRRLRLEILERDGWRCQVPTLTGEPCGATFTPRESMHVDHIVPMRDGGEPLDPANLRAACPACNVRRVQPAKRNASRRWYQKERTPKRRVPSREW